MHNEKQTKNNNMEYKSAELHVFVKLFFLQIVTRQTSHDFSKEQIKHVMLEIMLMYCIVCKVPLITNSLMFVRLGCLFSVLIVRILHKITSYYTMHVLFLENFTQNSHSLFMAHFVHNCASQVINSNFGTF